MATHLDLEEQEQLDALKHFWNRWGNLITWVLIAVLGAYAAWNGWQYWQRRQAGLAAVMYDEIARAANAGDMARVERALADMKDKYGGTTYAAYAGLEGAKVLADKGKLAEAKTALAGVVDKASDDGLRAVARLRLASLQTGEKAYDEALKTLSASFPAQYTALAADRRGDVLLLQGKRSEAATEFGKAYQGLTADSGEYRRLVGMKLNALGIDPDAGAKAGATS
ncbi:YfgM family protein [Ottowia testudinis]|uniref:Ancillary SecYEG translocon subunit n=1 Tax=Ottowia testudinis TaxID=2816950 RepID=A0A975CJ84_9BURK|nr:tetratricopeptide repeat protein [Ottowia testudinis]QTD44428.1 tetratricopeptide repeat protein [Ottowia testudinis]